MATAKILPPTALLQRLFRYDPTTGDLEWQPRPREDFINQQACTVWNKHFAGTLAGCGKGRRYRTVSINDCRYSAHRIIWKMATGEEPPELDHRDRNGLNNRLDNLRKATNSLNGANRKGNNPLGVRGVTPRCGRFRAQINVDGKKHVLGTFTTVEEAHAAYRRAAIQFFGEFASFD